jgi:hypothetical protein
MMPDTAGGNRQDPEDFFAQYQFHSRSIMLFIIPNDSGQTSSKGVKP